MKPSNPGSSTRLTQNPKLFSACIKSAPPPTPDTIRTWIAPYRALIDYHLNKTLTAPRITIQPARRENAQTWLTRVLSSHLGNHQPLRTSNLVNQLINLELDLCRAAEGLPWLKPILSDIANLTDLPAAAADPSNLPNPQLRKKASAWLIARSCQTRTHMDDLPGQLREEDGSSWAQITLPKLPEPCPPPDHWTDIRPAARVNSAPRRMLQTQFLASIDPAAKHPEPLVIIDDPATLPCQPRTKSTPNRTQPRKPNNHTGLRDLYRDFPQLLDH